MLHEIQDDDLELSEEGLVEVREHKATISAKKEKDEFEEQENGTAPIKDDDVVVDIVITNVKTDEPDMKTEQEGEPDDDKNDSDENDETDT